MPDKFESFVRDVWLLALGREPDAASLQRGLSDLTGGADSLDFFNRVAHSAEAIERRALLREIPMFVPAGHPYSPIVHVGQLRDAGFREQRRMGDPPGIKLDYARMQKFLASIASQDLVVRYEPPVRDGLRYRPDNDMFGIGDAVLLSAIIQRYRPRRIVEVGCGFSSAVVLDTLDGLPRVVTHYTLIDPDLERARSLFKPHDHERMVLIEEPVQRVSLNIFEELLHNDILLLDTTHVAKTGSDVTHVLFNVLPSLAPGVIIHIHDIFSDFEYPDSWIFRDNRSWNESYLLHAFLMYNDDFDILYFSDAFAKNRRSKIAELLPIILDNPGGGLWLRRR